MIGKSPRIGRPAGAADSGLTSSIKRYYGIYLVCFVFNFLQPIMEKPISSRSVIVPKRPRAGIGGIVGTGVSVGVGDVGVKVGVSVKEGEGVSVAVGEVVGECVTVGD